MYTPLLDNPGEQALDQEPVTPEYGADGEEFSNPDDDKSAGAICPGEFRDKTKRGSLGAKLTDLLSAAERQRQPFEPRWDRLHGLYEGNAPGRSYSPYSGCADEHFNIIQPRLDALAGIVVGTVTSKEPYCRASMWDDDDQSLDHEIETRVFKYVDRARYSTTLKRCAVCAGWSNAAHTYVEYGEGGLSITHKHPTEVLIYPATVDRVEDAEMYAVRVWRVKSQIEEMQESGYYFSLPDIPSGQGPGVVVVQNMPETMIVPDESPRSEYDPIGLWKCYFKEKGKMYGAVLHKDTATVLRIWEYKYKTPCLQKYSYKVSSDDRYWTPGSVANDLQGYQLTVNELANMAVDGLRASAFSTIAVPSPVGNDNMDSKIGPGDVMPVAGLDRAVSFLANINLAPIQGFIGMYLQQSDTAARISPLSAASQLRPNTTATEASGVMQGQAESRDDYIETWSTGVEKVFEHVHELLSMHTEWGLPTVDQVRWSAQSTSPAASPEGVVQMLTQILQVAAVPGAGIDVHALIKALLEALERMGLAVAKDIQPDQQNAQIPTEDSMQPGPMGGMGANDPNQILAQLLQQATGGGNQGPPELQG